MAKHPKKKRYTPSSGTILVGTLAMVVAFGLGIQQSGDVVPAQLVESGGSTVIRGDLDADGLLTVDDVRLALEYAQGYRKPEARSWAREPVADGSFTVDDALWILSHLSDRGA